MAYRDVFRPYLPEPALVAQDIQAQFRELGITVNITGMESGAFVDASDRGELALFLQGWIAAYPDQTDFLSAHFGKGANKHFDAGYEDVWALLDRAGAVSDSASEASSMPRSTTWSGSTSP